MCCYQIGQWYHQPHADLAAISPVCIMRLQMEMAVVPSGSYRPDGGGGIPLRHSWASTIKNERYVKYQWQYCLPHKKDMVVTIQNHHLLMKIGLAKEHKTNI